MSCSNLSMSWLNAARLRSLAVKARKVSSSSEETLICNCEVHWTKKCTGHKKASETMNIYKVGFIIQTDQGKIFY